MYPRLLRVGDVLGSRCRLSSAVAGIHCSDIDQVGYLSNCGSSTGSPRSRFSSMEYHVSATFATLMPSRV